MGKLAAVAGLGFYSLAACMPSDGKDAVLAVDQPVADNCFGFDRLNDVAPFHDQGQTFTAPMTGHVFRVDMALGSERGSTIDLAFYDSEGFRGNVLHHEAVTPWIFTGSVTPIVEYPLLRAVPVVEGRIYTIGLAYVEQGGHGGFCGTNTNPYADGMTWNNDAPLPEQDSQFRLYMVPD
jgi:hypothetical protein